MIPPEHPCLAGHFPGEPVVPGVLTLDHVFALIGLSPDSSLSLAWVKFAQPLLPGQVAEVEWISSPAGIRFAVSCAGMLLVRGQLSGGPADG
jgi:3-hydroxymyristoyl/3-hydroxydecanoyl-(acyl carrier protein) dehydratase